MVTAAKNTGSSTGIAAPGPWQVVISFAAVALYARTVTFGWAFDDFMEIVRNVHVHSLRRLPDIFRSTVWAGSGMETYLYRPLVLVTYALNHAVSGLQAWSYHLVNVLLHGCASLLVFRLGSLWRLPVLAAGLGGLLFAVHPAYVEVVANVAGRKDLLAAVFVLFTALAHRSALLRQGWWFAAPPLLYACAVLSKEIGVMGLLLVLAQDIFLERNRQEFFSRRRVVAIYLAYIAVLTSLILVRLSVTGGFGVPETSAFDNPLVDAGVWVRLATAVVVIAKGMVTLVAPWVLSPDYSYDAIPLVESVTDARLWVTAAIVGLIIGCLTREGLRRSVLPLALAWYGLALLPATNLLITVGTIFGERLLYLPGVAFCLAVGWGLGWLMTHHLHVTLAATTLVVLAFAAQTVRYSSAWANDIALFEWATKSVPRSTKAHHKLGEEYLRIGRLGDALRSLDRALAIAPDNTFAIATRADARRAVVDRFGGSPGAAATVQDPDVLYSLGQSRMERGDRDGAAELWEAALVLDPDHAKSQSDLGAFRLEIGDTLGATVHLEAAVASNPSLASAWFNLAVIRLAHGRVREADNALRRFLGAAGPRYPSQVEWAREMLRRLEDGDAGR